MLTNLGNLGGLSADRVGCTAGSNMATLMAFDVLGALGGGSAGSGPVAFVSIAECTIGESWCIGWVIYLITGSMSVEAFWEAVIWPGAEGGTHA